MRGEINSSPVATEGFGSEKASLGEKTNATPDLMVGETVR